MKSHCTARSYTASTVVTVLCMCCLDTAPTGLSFNTVMLIPTTQYSPSIVAVSNTIPALVSAYTVRYEFSEAKT